MNKYEDIDTSTYKSHVKNKIKTINQALTENIELPVPEIFYSTPKNFRMRAEFNIFRDGNKIRYYMVEKDNGIKKRVFIERFAAGSILINTFMPLIAEYVSNNNVLSDKIFDIDFLTTLSGESLITLTYHKKLDATWEQEAKKLLEFLRSHNSKVNLIGRSYKQKILLERDYVWEELNVNGQIYKYQQVDNSFTQPNAMISAQMLAFVQNNTKNIGGDLLELYCGNGNFSIALSQNFNKVLATEISKSSVNSAQLNIEANNIKNLKILRMSAEEFTAALNEEREFRRLKQANVDLKNYDCQTILVDPPRAGLDEKTCNMIANYKNIIYVSCNPQTLKSNLEKLIKTHNVVKLAFFDQFPYTPHIETIVLLSKK